MPNLAKLLGSTALPTAKGSDVVSDGSTCEAEKTITIELRCNIRRKNKSAPT